MDNMILEASGIYKNYGDLAILKGLDFSIREGESCSIIGKRKMRNILSVIDYLHRVYLI